MADQTAAYLLDNTIKAQDAAGSFFKGIANKIRAFFKQYTEFFKKRFKRNPAFTDYVAEVTQLAKDPGRQMAYEYKAFIEGQVEQLGKEIPFGDPKAPKKIFDTMKFITGTGTVDKSVSFLNSLFNTSDDILRQLGEPGRALANIFRSLSQSEELTGMFTSAQSISLSKMNEITEILGIKPYTYVGTVKSLIPFGKKLGIKSDEGITEEIMEVLYEAENEQIATKDLKDPRAKALRQWFTDHYNGKGMGMSLKEVGIAFRENFFTRKLDVHEISGNPVVYNALVQLIMAKSPTTISQEKAEAIVNSIIEDPSTADVDITEANPGDFAIGLTKQRVAAFENITTSELRAINAIVEPHVALQSYVDNTVKKVELKKRGGPQQIEKHIQEIKEQFGEEKAQLATDVVRSMLGKHAKIGGMLRGVNQIGLLWNVTTLLTFATFASFPDVAGPILRSRSFKELRQNMSLIFDQLSRDEATKLAYDIGAISMDAMTQTYVGAGELDYLSADTKEKTNAFFRLVGLEQFTKFTRIFAASMGKSFLLNNAEKAKAGDAKAQANLRELNVTADQVLSWGGGDVTAAGNEAVKQALARFVDESIVRPNSAERPAWANDPRYALVWQLKQFFYSYGKTIVGGNIREMQRRYENEGIRGASVPLFMGALTLLPLTMLGFDLRERFKIGMAYVLPGVSPSDKNYRRSKEMDWGEYTIEVIDRSGILGPFTMALPLFMSEKRYGDPLWVGPLGPSVEKGYDLLTGNLRVKDLTPFYSSL